MGTHIRRVARLEKFYMPERERERERERILYRPFILATVESESLK